MWFFYVAFPLILLVIFSLTFTAFNNIPSNLTSLNSNFITTVKKSKNHLITIASLFNGSSLKSMAKPKYKVDGWIVASSGPFRERPVLTVSAAIHRKKNPLSKFQNKTKPTLEKNTCTDTIVSSWFNRASLSPRIIISLFWVTLFRSLIIIYLSFLSQENSFKILSINLIYF